MILQNIVAVLIPLYRGLPSVISLAQLALTFVLLVAERRQHPVFRFSPIQGWQPRFLSWLQVVQLLLLGLWARIGRLLSVFHCEAVFL